jgi:hypothetical protein
MTTHATSPRALPVSGGAAAGEDASSVAGRAQWVGLGLLIFAASLVFWAFDALPFQDLPGHAGLIAIRHRFAESAFEQRFFVMGTGVGPYSLFLYLGEWLDKFVGPTRAVRVLGTLPVIATPLVLLFARRRLHGDRSLTAGFLGVALSFGFMTLMGLASYLLGMALMLLTLTVWLELLVTADEAHGRNGDPSNTGQSETGWSKSWPSKAWQKELLFAALALLVFIAHGHAFALLVMLTGLTALATGNRVRRALRWRALLPALLLAAWSAERGGPPKGSVARADIVSSPHFQDVSDKLSLLVTPTLMTRTGIDILLGVVLWIVVVASVIATVRALVEDRPLLSLLPTSVPHVAPRVASPADAANERSRAHSRALAVAAAGVAVVFFALPHAFGWFGFIDGRLVPLFLFLSIMCIRRSALTTSLESALDWGAPAVACAMTGLVLVASYRFQEEASGYREIFAMVPREARLLNLPLDPYSDVFTAHPFVHYDKLIVADRPVVLSDVWAYPGSALYPTPENPSVRLPSSYREADLRFIDWPAYRLEDWDYVLIRTHPNAPAPSTPTSLSLARHAGGWWLYQTGRAL